VTEEHVPHWLVQVMPWLPKAWKTAKALPHLWRAAEALKENEALKARVAELETRLARFEDGTEVIDGALYLKDDVATKAKPLCASCWQARSGPVTTQLTASGRAWVCVAEAKHEVSCPSGCAASNQRQAQLDDDVWHRGRE
jgi:hypothetical protein